MVTEMTALGPRQSCIQPNTKKFVTRSHDVRVSFFSNEDIDGQGFRAFYSAGRWCFIMTSWDENVIIRCNGYASRLGLRVSYKV